MNTNSNLPGTVARYFLVSSEEWTLRLSSIRRILSPAGYLASSSFKKSMYDEVVLGDVVEKVYTRDLFRRD